MEEDLISREAALNCFHDWIDKHGDVYAADEIPEYQAIEALPSAQPEKEIPKRVLWSRGIEILDINARTVISL